MTKGGIASEHGERGNPVAIDGRVAYAPRHDEFCNHE